MPSPTTSAPQAPRRRYPEASAAAGRELSVKKHAKPPGEFSLADEDFPELNVPVFTRSPIKACPLTIDLGALHV